MSRQYSKLAIIIPCFNEEPVIQSTVETLLSIMDGLILNGKISDTSYIYLIDDGSKDNTWKVIEKLRQIYGDKIKGTKFIRNYGNQKALIAGLLGVREIGCDCVISIDADLQQDENSIEKFIDEFHNGADIVSGIRNNRKTDSLFKKTTAFCFYKLMNILGVKIPPNHSDFRLVSKHGLDILAQYPEEGLFLRGFFHEIGLKTAYVYFDVKPRLIGKSKFNFFSLTSLALNGITAFSIVPLRIIAAVGVITVIGSIMLTLEVLFEKYILHNAPSGWATLVILLAFFGGLQIFCLGIIGEYLGQIFNEVKARPRYIKEIELK
ncbi:glycosyltransferase family 2 protein [bacterium]|nr:glycosyltransferase family 2 protein [bacterium]